MNEPKRGEVDSTQFLESEEKELAAKDFAAEIKLLRNKARISQRELSKRIGVEQPIITRIEAGSYNITLDLVRRLAIALNDNPHRLADVYWGDNPLGHVDKNKEVLDVIYELLQTHYSKQFNAPPQPYRVLEMTPEMEAEITEADRVADEITAAKKRPKQRINETPPQN